MLSKIFKVVSSIAVLSFFVSVPANAIPLVNEALNGTASQSSTWSGNFNGSSDADNVIDGDTNGIWQFGNEANNSLNHTNIEQGAWWEVDLGQLINIDSIVIWNRTDCCISRLNNFGVWLDNVLIGSYNQNNGPTPTFSLLNLNMAGQVVRVQLNDSDYLHLAEVQVFAMARDVPEPAPLALLGLGLLGLGLVRRRRR